MRLPRLEANLALTVDGKVATKQRCPTNFTSSTDKRRMQEIRAKADAVIVGRLTLETDNMTMRLIGSDLRKHRVVSGKSPEPLRVIFTGSGCLRKTLKIFRSPGAPIVVFTTKSMSRATRTWLERLADVHVEPRGKSVNIRRALQTLASTYGVRSALCEGGPALLKQFIQEGLLHRLNITFAPVIFGGSEAPTLLGPATSALLPRSFPLKLDQFEVRGKEAFAAYSVKTRKKLAFGRQASELSIPHGRTKS
jgi:2,5-diamino-6-(ribosylamino)-4(3H)-pyrimidinone 5'-phosphate reductase